MLKNILNSKLAKSSFFYTLSDALNKGIPVLLMPILITYLSSEEYGIMANFISLVRISSSFIGLNSSAFYTTNYYSSNEKEKKTTISAIGFLVSTSFILISIVFVCFDVQLRMLTDLDINWLILANLIASFDVINTLYTSKLRLDHQPLRFGVFENLKSLLEIGSSLALIILLNYKFEGRVIGMIIASCALFIYAAFRLRIFPINSLNINFIKEILTFSLPITAHQSMMWIKNGFDKFYITFVFGVSFAGQFTVGYQVSMILFLFTGAFNKAYNPYLFKTLTNNNSKNNLTKIRVIYIFVVIFLSFAVFIAGYVFFNYYASDEYKFAFELFVYLLIGQVFNAIYLIYNGYLFFHKKTKVLGSITMLVSIIHISTSILLSNLYGIKGIAISNVLSAMLNSILVYRAAKPLMKITHE